MKRISLTELVICLSELVDLVNVIFKDHHKKVACASYHFATQMGIVGKDRLDIILAASLHDVGGVSINERISATLSIEDTKHAGRGYKLLTEFDPFENMAKMIRFHHTPWKCKTVPEGGIEVVHQGSYILFLADRLVNMIDANVNVLCQKESIMEDVLHRDRQLYTPEIIAGISALGYKDYFWLDVTSYSLKEFLLEKMQADDILLSYEYVTSMAEMFSHIIDFKSEFTATHSREVAAVSKILAELMHFPSQEIEMMYLAGLLHDIGKLAIPAEILEKNGPLEEEERNIIRSHAYYTEKVLSNLSGFEKIRQWAAYHHESLNGGGYPFSLCDDALPLGSKIMKVADIFVALMEDRPYRKGMKLQKAMTILDEMAQSREIDAHVLAVLKSHVEPINAIRYVAEQKAKQKYERFIEGVFA